MKLIELPTKEQFVEYIKEHLKKTGEKPSSFGRRVLNDSGVLSRLFDGTDPRLTTMNTINDAIIKEVEDEKKTNS